MRGETALTRRPVTHPRRLSAGKPQWLPGGAKGCARRDSNPNLLIRRHGPMVRPGAMRVPLSCRWRCREARLSSSLSSELSSAHSAKQRHSQRFLIPGDPALTIGCVKGGGHQRSESKTSFTQSRSGSQTLRNEVALDQATIPALCSPARRRPRRYGTGEQADGKLPDYGPGRQAEKDLCGHLGVWLHPQVLTGPVVLKGDGTVVRAPARRLPVSAVEEGTHSREPPSDTSPVCGGFRPLRKTDGRIAYHQVRGQRCDGSDRSHCRGRRSA